MRQTLQELGDRIAHAAIEYNSQAAPDARIARVSVFGSYAEGTQTEESDVDLLVAFDGPVVSFLSLAKVLEIMEARTGLSVDVVQDPLPEGAFLKISKAVPVYEAA